MISAVLDTNVILAMAAGHDRTGSVMAVLWNAWQGRHFHHVTSRFVLIETGRHLAEGYFADQVSDHIQQITMQRLRTDNVDVQFEVRIGVASHPEDDRVMAIALQEKVNFLVTGDKQLLLRDGFEGLRIITPRQFVDTLEAGLVESPAHAAQNPMHPGQCASSWTACHSPAETHALPIQTRSPS